MKMYEIYLESSAEKDLRKLSKKQIENIVANIRTLSKSPFPKGVKKIKDSNNFWRIMA